MTDPIDRFGNLVEAIEAGERGGCEQDREVLLELAENLELVPSKVGEYRRRDILRRATQLSEGSPPLVEVLEDRDAAERVVRWIHRNYDNEHTNQDFRKDLRAFGRYYLQQEDVPETLEWIPTGTSNSFNPAPSERDLLRYEEEILPMVDAARNARDAALVMVQFESGCRPNELWDLRVGDVFDADHTTGIHVDGKLGERTVHLIVAVPYLQRWLEDHPGDEGDYLWSKLDSPERASYNTFLEYFRNLGERAGIEDKKVTPRNFRKSNTRWLAILGFHQARIEDRQGRTRGSKHTARYLAKFGPESNEIAYAQLHGREVEPEQGMEVGPIECPRCHRETPSERDFCMWCHFALGHDAIEQVEEQDERMFESGVQAEDAQTVEDVRTVRSDVVQLPGIRRAMLDD